MAKNGREGRKRNETTRREIQKERKYRSLNFIKNSCCKSSKFGFWVVVLVICLAGESSARFCATNWILIWLLAIFRIDFIFVAPYRIGSEFVVKKKNITRSGFRHRKAIWWLENWVDWKINFQRTFRYFFFSTRHLIAFKLSENIFKLLSICCDSIFLFQFLVLHKISFTNKMKTFAPV